MMNKIIQKARIIEQRIKVKREINKTIKKQAYRVFLQDPPRPLPDLQRLQETSLLFFLGANILMTIPTLQIIFFYHTLYINGPDFIVTACGLLATPQMIFTIIIDIAIWKRFGIQHTWYFKHIPDLPTNYW